MTLACICHVQALVGKEEDWYKVLGVARSAEPSVIRSAYRKLVLKWHPGQSTLAFGQEKVPLHLERVCVQSVPEAHSEEHWYTPEGRSRAPGGNSPSASLADLTGLITNVPLKIRRTRPFHVHDCNSRQKPRA